LRQRLDIEGQENMKATKRGYLRALFVALMIFQISIVPSLAIDSPALKSMPMDMPPPKITLVLGGGGLRGVAHIAVLQALLREGIKPDLVVGTSIGALVGGLYCAGIQPDVLRREAVKGFVKNFYTAPIPVQLLKIPFFLLVHKNPQGIFAGGKLGKSIDKRVRGNREISEYQPKFAAVTTDLIEGRPFVITHGDVGEALQASAAIPVFRKPVHVGKALLVDGGVVANLPVREARALGAKFVIAVDVDEKLEPINDRVFETKLGSISSRVVGLILARSDEMQQQEADVTIHPDVTGISLLSSKAADGDAALKAGDVAIEQMMPEIKRKLKAAGLM
jgi:NTE family protein